MSKGDIAIVVTRRMCDLEWVHYCLKYTTQELMNFNVQMLFIMPLNRNKKCIVYNCVLKECGNECLRMGRGTYAIRGPRLLFQTEAKGAQGRARPKSDPVFRGSSWQTAGTLRVTLHQHQLL